MLGDGYPGSFSSKDPLLMEMKESLFKHVIPAFKNRRERLNGSYCTYAAGDTDDGPRTGLIWRVMAFKSQWKRL